MSGLHHLRPMGPPLHPMDCGHVRTGTSRSMRAFFQKKLQLLPTSSQSAYARNALADGTFPGSRDSTLLREPARSHALYLWT